MIIDTAIVDTAECMTSDIPLPPTSGARVKFHGCVRNHDGGQEVTHLDYEAHPDAGKFLRVSVEKAAKNFSVDNIYVRHQVGRLYIGEMALLVIVDSAHRSEAFALAALIIDTIKQEVPIWKHQYYGDGTSQWSNCP
ncbi:MAG: molybdenum cofactor biosynthesis protein MoaE [Actinomycetaceae bacterium]|nr:molybdenum cofactor biosynthesis protein MoaE [Actinomycetaceae bacterium]